MKRKFANNQDEVQTTPKGFKSETFESPIKLDSNKSNLKLNETSDRILRSKKLYTSSSSSLSKNENKIKKKETLNFENDLYNPSSFISCLNTVDDLMTIRDSPRMITSSVLRRALSIKELEDTSWLSSSLIDLVISKFAKCYKKCIFMSIDFVVLALSNLTRYELEQATDIRGDKLNYDDPSKPIVFVCNSQNIHWNLIRIIRSPQPELQLFEPIGKPSNRHAGLSFRNIPRAVIQWLDICCPLPNNTSWITIGVSAITRQQQFTTFDCGVACLLYAEKCGQGQKKDEINDYTTQENLTNYRKIIQEFTKRVENYI